MKAELFSKALGEISDSYIEEAILYENTSRKYGLAASRKRRPATPRNHGLATPRSYDPATPRNHGPATSRNHGLATPRKRRLAKWGAAAACLILLLAACSLFLPLHRSAAVTVYAHGTDEEITAAGAVLSTGTISDSGKMKGKPLMFYLSGEDIATVRFSCKNQQLYFTDWTEKREEYGNAGNFTVAYGTDESEYYYLTIDWTPDTVIRELTDNPSSTIAGLPEDMREDIIVLEITFGDGGTATKAIQVSLLDDGTFFASFDDYEIGPADTFVQRADAPAIPREFLYAQGSEAVSSSADAPPMVYVNGILYRQSPQQICYDGKKAGFLYLGKIVSNVTERQSPADGAVQNTTAESAQNTAQGSPQNTTEGSAQNTAEGSAQNDAEGSAQNITNGIEQAASENIPKENLQANTPIAGAEVYQYNSDIVVLINGKYWLYEPIIGEGGTILEEYVPEGEAMLLDPSYAAHPPAPKEGTISAENAQDTPASPGGDLSSKAPGEAEGNQEAEEAARAYYAGTVFEVVSLEPENREGDTITFAVTVKKGGIVQEPERKITLRENQGTWEVTNEGY